MKLYVKSSTEYNVLDQIGHMPCGKSGKTIKEVASELNSEELSELVNRHNYDVDYYICCNPNVALESIRTILDRYSYDPSRLWNLVHNLSKANLIDSNVCKTIIDVVYEVFPDNLAKTSMNATTIRSYITILDTYCSSQLLLPRDEKRLSSLLDKLHSFFSDTKIQLGVKLNRQVINRLNDYASSTGVSKAKIVEDAINQYLDSH